MVVFLLPLQGVATLGCDPGAALGYGQIGLSARMSCQPYTTISCVTPNVG
ncbi:MAG: hypothetical protein SPF62_04295 [Prevotella sp.]|nr:hypothetical protein [Prevotella sp.]MDY5546535.1 hypothetical protein [Prevotella sp.]